jgi:hypothetical protein
MEQHYPMLLSRQKAMNFCGMGRKALENFVAKKNVRTFVTEGGHKRYFRDDLAKHLNEKSPKQ